MSLLNCVTQDVTPLNEQIFRIRIAAESGEIFDFKGGQYLFLLMPDGKKVPLSIASAPEEKEFIELHIRLMANGGLVEEMLALFNSNQVFQIDGPYGSCYLQDGDADVVMIAGGTGFAPMKSLLESALARGVSRNLSLYLGAQTQAELYQCDLVAKHDNKHSNFNYIPVLGKPDNEWQGKTGFPHQVALQELGDRVSACQFFISGSEAMVVNVYHSLKESGVASENIHSDIINIKREMGQLV